MISIQIIGRTTHDIELKYGQSGSAYCRFRLAGTTKTQSENAVFLDCTAFGRSAEIISNYVHKGDKILVLGEFKDNSYEKDGQKVTRYKVEVNDFELLETRKSEPLPNSDGFIPATTDDDALPFA